jgi:hypothetical protein
MRESGLPYQMVYDLVLTKHKAAFPNSGFRKQLKEYEIEVEEMRKKSSHNLK